MISRRGLIGGLLVTLAAPAIIRTPGLLMPVKSVKMLTMDDWFALNDFEPYIEYFKLQCALVPKDWRHAVKIVVPPDQWRRIVNDQ